MFTEVHIIICAWLIANGAVRNVEAQQCQNGYIARSGRCLRLFRTPATQSSAKSQCRSSGGRLASVLWSNDPVAIVGMNSGATRYWIGLSKTRTEWQFASVSGADRFMGPQGCYFDLTGFTDQIRIQSYVTPPLCSQQCRDRGRRYAGIRRMRRSQQLDCVCSDYFSPDRTKTASCAWPCPSNSGFSCGSEFNDWNSQSAQYSVLVYRLQNVHSSFDAWQRGQPNNNNGYQSCIALHVDYSVSSTFGGNDKRCAETRFWNGTAQSAYSYLCNYGQSSTSGCHPLKGICLSVFFETGKSWFAARQHCLDTGGDLLRVDDANILDGLVHWFRDIRDSLQRRSMRWWIDGTNERWNWEDGQQLGRYTNWMPNRPANEQNTCVAMASASPWQWTDENCDTATYPFVCELDPDSRTTTTTSTTTKSSSSSTPSTHLSNPTDIVTLTPPTARLRPLSTAGLSTAGLPVTHKVARNASGRPEKATTGVILSIVMTIVIMLMTTARMLVSCCCDKTRGDDTFN